MKFAVVGGGILGLTLGYRLAGLGHQIDVIEGEPRIGGLAGPQDYGSFVWDRFYHCILPQDAHLIALLGDLDLAGELRWTRTGTGYYARGQFFPMSGNKDFLRFPLLTLWDKMRLGAAIFWATRVADPDKLYQISAEEWLSQLCGRRTYELFWQPLLKAKFGPFHDRVAAVFIYATLVRLFGARSAAAGKESLGYVRGGYARILDRFEERLRAAGARIRTGTRVAAIEPAPSGGCRVTCDEPKAGRVAEEYDQVFFTAPTRLARKVVSDVFLPHVERVERDHPTSTTYLGVACLVLVLERPLTPYYVLNIGEPSVELTGLIEMTNLIDRQMETKGLSLVYLPRYMDSESPEFGESDDVLRRTLIDRGLKRLFPDFDERTIRYQGVHRARYVQPLPLVRGSEAGKAAAAQSFARPFQIINTSMLRCATLNNNEVVALVDRLIEQNQAGLVKRAESGPSSGLKTQPS
jgi:protoporphyrinogen oxidase